jgi:hypothetical protein
MDPDDLRALASLIATELAETTALRSFVASPADSPTPNTRGVQLVDAAALARDLSVSRRYVYEHRDELGGVPLGAGQKPRLRFDVAVARERFSRLRSERSDSANASESGRIAGSQRRRAARVPLGVPQPGQILRSRPRSAGDR